MRQHVRVERCPAHLEPMDGSVANLQPGLRDEADRSVSPGFLCVALQQFSMGRPFRRVVRRDVGRPGQQPDRAVDQFSEDVGVAGMALCLRGMCTRI
jgi:hypothetical protein